MRETGTDISKPMIQRIAEISTQRPIEQVAAEADYIFSDRTDVLEGWHINYVSDPLGEAIKRMKDDRKSKFMVIVADYYMILSGLADTVRAVKLRQDLKVNEAR